MRLVTLLLLTCMLVCVPVAISGVVWLGTDAIRPDEFGKYFAFGMCVMLISAVLSGIYVKLQSNS